jgi:hypothetical protein
MTLSEACRLNFRWYVIGWARHWGIPEAAALEIFGMKP